MRPPITITITITCSIWQDYYYYYYYYSGSLRSLLRAPCVAPEKVLIIDCKFVASRVFNLIVFKCLV